MWQNVHLFTVNSPLGPRKQFWCVFLLRSDFTPAGENRSADDNDSRWPHAHWSRQAPENHWGSPQSAGRSQKSSLCASTFPVYTRFYTFYASSLPLKHSKTSLFLLREFELEFELLWFPCSVLCENCVFWFKKKKIVHFIYLFCSKPVNLWWSSSETRTRESSGLAERTLDPKWEEAVWM